MTISAYMKSTHAGVEFVAMDASLSYFQAIGEDAVALARTADCHAWRTFTYGFLGLDPQIIYEVWSEQPLPDDAPFKRLAVIPSSVFEVGMAQGQENYSASPVFEPGSEAWEAVPAHMLLPIGHYFETVVLEQKRFCRLSNKGWAAKQEALAAAQREADMRRQQEAAAREKRREEERAAAEETRRQEEQRAEAEAIAKFQEWYASRPEPFKPGAFVLDMTEATPRLGRVDYAGVHPHPDGMFSWSVPVDKLPKIGNIVWNNKPHFASREAERVWEDNSWNQLLTSYCSGDWPHQVARRKQFLDYTGPIRPLGTRIEREEALAGRPDPCAPEFPGVEFVRIELIGNEYNSAAGELFTIYDAFHHLRQKAPSIPVRVRYEDDRGDEEDEDEEQAGRHIYYGSEDQDVQERYPQLSADKFSRWDDAWDDFNWQPFDRRLLKKEAERREKANIAWTKRRSLYQILARVLNARVLACAPDEDWNFGDQAMAFEIAIEGKQLDELVAKIRESGCQVFVWRVGEDEHKVLAAKHKAPSGEVWDQTWDCWEESKGSADLFLSFTHGLCPNRGVEFIINGFLARHTVGVLVGPPGLGKSSVAYEMAASVAAGVPFAGLKTAQGKVVFVYGEDSQDFITFRRQAAAPLTDRAGRNLIELNAGNFGRSLPALLEFIRTTIPGPIALIVIDTISSFVDTMNSAAVREAMGLVSDFCGAANSAAILIHHTTKELSPGSARSPKAVFEKTKGSGEIINAARQVWVMSLESEHRDPQKALAEGLRHITMMKDNIPVGVPRLQNSLALKMDVSTHLSKNMQEPVIAVGPQPGTTNEERESAKPVRKEPPAENVLVEAAKEIAAVIARIEADGHGAVPVTGPKSVFKLRRSDELVGWTRAKCEAAHRRAIELGLVALRR